jgi:methylamine utilization protein MauE
MGGLEEALSLLGGAIELLHRDEGFGVAMWFLGLVFAFSGYQKLRQPMLAAMAMVDFRVVRRVRPSFGSALAIFELCMAALLLTRFAPVLATSLAAASLGIFTVLIARGVRAGVRFPCFCFGEADGQLSARTLFRTATLAALASLLALGSWQGDAPPAWRQTFVLDGVVALSLLGVVVLVRHVPNLLRWNRDPLRVVAR